MHSFYLMFYNINLCLTFSKWLNISKMYPILDTFLQTSLPRLTLFNNYLILNFQSSTNPSQKLILKSLKVENKTAKEGELQAKREIIKKVEKIEKTTKRTTTITITMVEVDFSNQSSKTFLVS